MSKKNKHKPQRVTTPRPEVSPEKRHTGDSYWNWIHDPKEISRIPKPKVEERTIERIDQRTGESTEVHVTELSHLIFRRADGAVTVFGAATATSLVDTD